MCLSQKKNIELIQTRIERNSVNGGLTPLRRKAVTLDQEL